MEDRPLDSTDFYYQWGKECALNNLLPRKVKETIKSTINLTEQNKNDILQGYEENKLEYSKVDDIVITESLNRNYYELGQSLVGQIDAQGLEIAIQNDTSMTSEHERYFRKGYNGGSFKEPEIRKFEIYFTDLNDSAKKEICEVFDTTAKEENWDINIVPLAIFERSMEDTEDGN